MPTTPEADAALEQFAALDEQELARPWRFRDKPMDVRYALYRTIEDAQESLVGIAAQPHPESRRILALAQRAFGDLRGLLIGVPSDLLDRAPREGEWPLREILRHVIVIEGRYAVRRIVRRLTALLGEVEGLSGRAEAREIGNMLVDRARSTRASS
jgi:hypothetical protein